MMNDNSRKTWPQWLQENDAINAFGNRQCVLVQNIPNEVAMEKVKLYFENKRRSGGGNIRTIAKLADGVLIIYKDDRCVENVLKKDQILNDARLKLFARTIPALCRDRFLLQNVGSDTALDTVEMLLENCDMPKHRCPNLIQDKMEGQYLAVYDEDIELAEVSSVAQNVSGRALEGHNLQVNLLYPSNALLVEDIPNGNSKEHIKEFFQNLDNCSDINVTMVEMWYSNTAVVSFAECQHAENVVRLHNDVNLKIDGCCLKVSLYYHDLLMDNTDCIGDSSDEFHEKDYETSIVQSGNNQQQYHDAGKYTIPHGHAILSFLGFNVLRKSIQSKFSHYAKLTLSIEEETVYIQYSQPKNVEPLTLLGYFEEFFSKYGSEFVTAKQDDISELRLSNGWKEDEEIIEIKVGSKKVKVLAKWSGNQVQITGNKEDVDLAVKELIRLFNTTSETLVLNKYNLRMFMRSGCLDDFASDVLKVECNESNSSVTFTGAEQNVKQAKQDLAFKLLNMRNTVVNTKSVQVQTGWLSLKRNIQIQTDLTDAQTVLHKEQVKKPAKVGQAITRKADNNRDLGHNSTEIPTDRDDPLTQKEFSDIISVDKDIFDYIKLSKSDQIKRIWKTCRVQITPLNHGKENIQIKVSSNSNSNVEKAIADFQDLYQDVQDRIIHESLDLQSCSTDEVNNALEVEQSDNVHVYQSSKGKINFIAEDREAIKESKRIFKQCVPTLQGHRQPSKPVSVTTYDNYVEVYKFVTHGGITVSVGHGNIAHQRVDAIVNAANTKLQNGAGVTGAIFKHGGPEFEKECRNKMSQCKIHPLNVGEVVEVRATGKLACKSVLHLAGPVWYRYSDKQYAFDILKYGLESVLYECQSHGFATLALPPVATGIYGTPLNVFVDAMLKALSTFEQKYRSSQRMINYIRILSIDDHTVATLAFLFANAIGHQFSAVVPAAQSVTKQVDDREETEDYKNYPQDFDYTNHQFNGHAHGFNHESHQSYPNPREEIGKHLWHLV